MEALYIAAWTGLILSIAVHITSIFAPDDFFYDIDGIVMMLHGTGIILGFFAFLASQKIIQGTEKKEFWMAIFENCPMWARRMVSIFFLYAAISFVIFLITGMGKHVDNSSTSVFRDFSGAWMLIYSINIAIFYSYLKKYHQSDKESNSGKQCGIKSLVPNINLRRYSIIALIAGSIFITLLWLAIKGYPWYLGITMFSFFPFVVLHALYFLYDAIRTNTHLRRNYPDLWKNLDLWRKQKKLSYADRREAAESIKELDDPYLKSCKLKFKKFSIICFWAWLVLIVIVQIVVAVIHYKYW